MVFSFDKKVDMSCPIYNVVMIMNIMHRGADIIEGREGWQILKVLFFFFFFLLEDLANRVG
jgi:hypothetical protein